MTSKMIRPVSGPEFASIMKQIWPSSGWSSSLAVANSGGPDSTCLLFLLHKYFTNPESAPERSPSVVSITIDHDLQKSSTHMAEIAEKNAKYLGIRHLTSRIPWGKDEFSPKPGPNGAMEEMARVARYQLLYQRMEAIGANAVAFGHHKDDQVETMLMRLGRGSSVQGLGGMWPLSRKGMGDRDEEESGIRWTGYKDLNCWKLRPLLTIPKDRLLATCEENGLEYVTDPTNFQPSLTIRNAIRHAIDEGVAFGTDPQGPTLKNYPPHLAEQLISINTHAEKFPSVNMYLHSGKDNLYQALDNFNKGRVETTRKVDEIFNTRRKRSPPGTVLLPYNTFRDIKDETVRIALVWKIMKYVSPSPWGSVRSEGHRRQESVERLLSTLCNDKAHESAATPSLSIGSRVWWRLLRKTTHGYGYSINVRDGPLEDIAWLACRSPQSRYATHDPLNLDITPQLRSAYQEWKDKDASPLLRLIYDCRFLLTFDVSQLGVQGVIQHGKVLVNHKQDSKWFLPQVVVTGDDPEDIPILVHDHIERDDFTWEKEWTVKHHRRPPTVMNGITIKYIRPSTSL